MPILTVIIAVILSLLATMIVNALQQSQIDILKQRMSMLEHKTPDR